MSNKYISFLDILIVLIAVVVDLVIKTYSCLPSGCSGFAYPTENDPSIAFLVLIGVIVFSASFLINRENRFLHGLVTAALSIASVFAGNAP